MNELKPFIVKIDGDESRRRLLGHAGDALRLRSGQVVLKTGESVGEHSTEAKEELIIILKGMAEIVSSKHKPLIAGEDSLAYIPPQTTHNVKNIGKGLLKYIYIVTPTN